MVVVSYVVSGEVGDKGDRIVARLKRYIPLQSLKIVIVAWQILTQVRENGEGLGSRLGLTSRDDQRGMPLLDSW